MGHDRDSGAPLTFNQALIFLARQIFQHGSCVLADYSLPVPGKEDGSVCFRWGPDTVVLGHRMSFPPGITQVVRDNVHPEVTHYALAYHPKGVTIRFAKAPSFGAVEARYQRWIRKKFLVPEKDVTPWPKQ